MMIHSVAFSMMVGTSRPFSRVAINWSSGMP
jgi:hypothetical protein